MLKSSFGDCRAALDAHAPFDLLIADPPYGGTSLKWDQQVEGWWHKAEKLLKPNGSIWVFGSMAILFSERTICDQCWFCFCSRHRLGKAQRVFFSR